jgi:hypothetical protein
MQSVGPPPLCAALAIADLHPKRGSGGPGTLAGGMKLNPLPWSTVTEKPVGGPPAASSKPCGPKTGNDPPAAQLDPRCTIAEPQRLWIDTPGSSTRLAGRQTSAAWKTSVPGAMPVRINDGASTRIVPPSATNESAVAPLRSRGSIENNAIRDPSTCWPGM